MFGTGRLEYEFLAAVGQYAVLESPADRVSLLSGLARRPKAGISYDAPLYRCVGCPGNRSLRDIFSG
jgi:hypothetical protein